jgi:hypothetical protein
MPRRTPRRTRRTPWRPWRIPWMMWRTRTIILILMKKMSQIPLQHELQHAVLEHEPHKPLPHKPLPHEPPPHDVAEERKTGRVRSAI